MSIKSSVRQLLTLGKGVATGLPDAAADADPFELFMAWYQAAEDSGLIHPEAMALATATPQGRPSVRMVLLKEVESGGFVFFTNYESRKSRELDANPHASLCFHWAVLERQVRVEGRVERTSRDQSEAYFRSRSRGSRIGAWASEQSRPLPDRETLEGKVREASARFEGEDVPLPPFWGGYRLVPHRMEFWQGRADRLHDRLVFEVRADGWHTVRLYP